MPINMTDWADGDLITKDRLNRVKNEAASVSEVNTFFFEQRAPTPPSGNAQDLVNREFYFAHLPSGGSGGSGGTPTREVSLGNMTGTVNLDLDSIKEVNAFGTLTGNTTLTTSNVPPSGLVSVTLYVKQDGTGGRSLTFPGTPVFLNGGDGSIASGPNEESAIVLMTIDGGTTWLIAVADVRPLAFEDFYWSFAGDGDVVIGFSGDRTLDFSQAVKGGTGTITAYKSTTGGASWGSALSVATSFSNGHLLKVSASSVGTFCSYTVPRTA